MLAGLVDHLQQALSTFPPSRASKSLYPHQAIVLNLTIHHLLRYVWAPSLCRSTHTLSLSDHGPLLSLSGHALSLSLSLSFGARTLSLSNHEVSLFRSTPRSLGTLLLNALLLDTLLLLNAILLDTLLDPLGRGSVTHNSSILVRQTSYTLVCSGSGELRRYCACCLVYSKTMRGAKLCFCVPPLPTATQQGRGLSGLLQENHVSNLDEFCALPAW